MNISAMQTYQMNYKAELEEKLDQELHIFSQEMIKKVDSLSETRNRIEK